MQDGKGAKEYEPNEDTVALFTRYCGVSSKQEIAERGRRIREKALISYPYRCIQGRYLSPPFLLTSVQSTGSWRLVWLIIPAIGNSLRGKTRRKERWVKISTAQKVQSGYQVLDIGCCMGTDARVMLSDGFVTEDNFTGVDICNDFIQLGYELFEDKDRLHCKFMVRNIPSSCFPVLI